MKVCGKSLGSRKCAQDKISGPFKRTILIAGMGTSPAVLTEKKGGHRANVICFTVETKP